MLVGKVLGPFVVEKEIGAGAMGAVYRGRQKETGKQVAIKIVAPGLASNEKALERFEREAKILKQLRHPNIVQILASGRFQKTPFYVMEYIEGESLDHVMERRGRIAWEEVVAWGLQLCAALQYAHDKGIIHRDLKPSNLMVLKDGTLKLTDFGIAKDIDATALTAANATVGTAAYMSPEQCRGSRDLTYKSDLYSMGVMFYELLTGRKPFQAETIIDMFNQHLKGTFERPSRLVPEIPIWLDTLVCQLMEKEPEKRPFSGSLVAESLAMVKEKALAQQSAGLDRAKKRKIDKSAGDAALDDTDKEAILTLLDKKKKKRKIAFYRKGWFTGVAIVALLAAVGTGLYFGVFKAPSAEALYAQAEKGIAASDEMTRKETREGPIADFLTLYPDHPKTEKVRAWADLYDRDLLEKQMLNRRARNMAIDKGDMFEPSFRAALDAEDDGRLDKARKNWQILAKGQGSKEAEPHTWSLIARKYLNELDTIDKLHADLRDKVLIENALKKPTPTDSEAEEMALGAVRAEMEENVPKARLAWEDLKKKVDSDSPERRYYLLAAYRHRDLANVQQKEAKKEPEM